MSRLNAPTFGHARQPRWRALDGARRRLGREMRGKIDIETREDFETWVLENVAAPAPAPAHDRRVPLTQKPGDFRLKHPHQRTEPAVHDRRTAAAFDAEPRSEERRVGRS